MSEEEDIGCILEKSVETVAPVRSQRQTVHIVPP